eukprot:COSAG02_NODE_1581_length_11839_cov_9.055451_9_plen_89_part_00
MRCATSAREAKGIRPYAFCLMPFVTIFAFHRSQQHYAPCAAERSMRTAMRKFPMGVGARGLMRASCNLGDDSLYVILTTAIRCTYTVV